MPSYRISDAEWEIMSVLWQESPLPSSEVVERVAARKGWRSRTIRTLLNRLVEKGAVRFARDRRPRLYEAALIQEDCMTQESRSFLERVFGGEPASMVLHMVKHDQLTPADIEKLKTILARKRK